MADDDSTPAPRETHGESHKEQPKHGGNFLAAKLGPLPVWAWAIAIVGAYIAVRWWKNNQANQTSTVTGEGGAAPSGSDQTSTPSTSTSPTPSGPATNLAWVKDAEIELKALGYSPQLIRTSLDRYLAGEQLDQREEALIETAINTLGAPPTGGNFGTLAKAKPKAPDIDKGKTQHEPPKASTHSGHTGHGSGPGR